MGTESCKAIWLLGDPLAPSLPTLPWTVAHPNSARLGLLDSPGWALLSAPASSPVALGTRAPG